MHGPPGQLSLIGRGHSDPPSGCPCSAWPPAVGARARTPLQPAVLAQTPASLLRRLGNAVQCPPRTGVALKQEVVGCGQRQKRDGARVGLVVGAPARTSSEAAGSAPAESSTSSSEPEQGEGVVRWAELVSGLIFGCKNTVPKVIPKKDA